MSRAFALLCALWATGALAQSELRVAVVIGDNQGDPGEAPLQYAESDARRFHAMLTELGQVAPERAALVLGGDAAEVRAAFHQARGRLAELRGHGRTVLVVYVSSHADADAVHLAGTHLALDELRELLAPTLADLRLVIVDACRTPVPSRAKGGRPGPEVEVAVERPSQVKGAAMITAAGDGEPAQEWGFLGGALFSHHLMAGLRGLADVDHDGAVTLAEMYTYAYSKTVAQSVLGSSGLQRPTFEVDIGGFGDWALTRQSPRSAAVVFAPELEGTFWVVNAAEELVTQVAKRPGDSARVSLAPGWYRVFQRSGRWADAADVRLGAGQQRTLAPGDLTRVPLAAVAVRGGAPLALRPWRVGVSAALGAGPVGGAQPGGELYLQREWSTLFVRLTAGAGSSGEAVGLLTTRETEVWLTLAVGGSLRVGPVALALALEARAAGIFQAVNASDPAQAAELERVFHLIEPGRSAFAPGGAVWGGAWLPLTDRLWLDARVSLCASAVRQWDDSLRLALQPAVAVGVGWSF